MDIQIVVPENSHLRDCVQKIMNGEVGEKALLFAERYCNGPRTLADRYVLPTDEEAKDAERRFFKEWKQFSADINAAPVIPERTHDELEE